MKIVKKNISPRYFRDVIMGIKTFEICKDEDDIHSGDVVEFLEQTDEDYTGRKTQCVVSYVQRNCPECGLMDGYCIMGLQLIREFKVRGDCVEYISIEN